MSNRVIHFEIAADNLERAKDFYEKTFGWEITKMMDAKDSGSEMDYWGVKTGPEGTPGINGGMYELKEERKHHTYHCTIMVENIDEAIAMVKKNGGQIIKEKNEIPKVGWFASAKDTEGNMFGLMQPTDWQPK